MEEPLLPLDDLDRRFDPVSFARLWNYVLPSVRVGFSGQCWLCSYRMDVGGYPSVLIAGRELRVSHISFQHFNARLIRAGLLVLHDCDVRSCVNPSHLHLGSHADNMRERRARAPVSRRLTEVERGEILRCFWESAWSLSLRLGVSRMQVYDVRKRGKRDRYFSLFE